MKLARSSLLGLLQVVVVVLFMSFLYQKTQTVVPERHTQIVSSFRHLQQLDSLLNQQFLEVRYGMEKTYDPLVNTISEMKSVYLILETELRKGELSQNKSIRSYLEKYSESFKRKELLLETFKSRVALLNNSLRYLPTAAEHIIKILPKNDVHAPHQLLNLIVRNTLLFNITGDKNLIPVINASVSSFQSMFQANEDLEKKIRNLGRHVQIIVDEKSEVAELMRRLISVSTSGHLDELHHLYNVIHQRVIDEANAYRLILYLCALLLLAYIGFVLIKLNHSVKSLSFAEAGLRKSEAHLRGTLETVVDAIITIDEGGIITSLNPAAEGMFGYSFTEILGQNIKILMPKVYSDNHDGWLANYLQHGQKSIIGKTREITGLRKGEKTFPIELSVTEMKIDGKRSYTGVIRDITERKKSEKELIEYRDDLEKMVEARTRELVVAKNQALESTRAKSEFLSSMSHELRTPLNSVIGFTGIVKDGLAGPINEEQSKQLDMVYTSSMGLLKIINDILDLSKVESGKIVVINEIFEIQPLAATLIDMLSLQANEKGVSLRLECPDDLPLLNTDRVKLYQVLLNVLNNGLKFTAEGSVVLRCTTDGSSVLFQVEDTGIGIKKEDLGKIFDAFEQVDSRTERVYEGTGLGLSISKQFVELLGGTLTVESEFGKGCVFTVAFPYTVVDAGDRVSLV